MSREDAIVEEIESSEKELDKAISKLITLLDNNRNSNNNITGNAIENNNSSCNGNNSNNLPQTGGISVVIVGLLWLLTAEAGMALRIKK